MPTCAWRTQSPISCVTPTLLRTPGLRQQKRVLWALALLLQTTAGALRGAGNGMLALFWPPSLTRNGALWGLQACHRSACTAVSSKRTKPARSLVRPPGDHRPACSSAELEKVQDVQVFTLFLAHPEANGQLPPWGFLCRLRIRIFLSQPSFHLFKESLKHARVTVWF